MSEYTINTPVERVRIEQERADLWRLDIGYVGGSRGMAWEQTVQEATDLANRLLDHGSLQLFSEDYRRQVEAYMKRTGRR